MLLTCVDSGSHTVGVSTLPTSPAISMPMDPGYAACSAARICPGQSAERRVVSVGSPENAYVSACVPTSTSVAMTLPELGFSAWSTGICWSSMYGNDDQQLWTLLGMWACASFKTAGWSDLPESARAMACAVWL